MTKTDRELRFSELVRNAASERPDAVAAIVDKSQCRYSDLVQRGERRARQLLAVGARKGDRIGILLPNCIEYIEILLGAAMLGVIVVPMNTRFKAYELRHLISDSGMIAIFTRSGIPGPVNFAEILAEALPGLERAADPRRLSLERAGSLRTIVMLDGTEGNFLADADLEPWAGPLPDGPVEADPLLLMYTSGTTANPKGCIIANHAIIANAWAIADRFGVIAADTWWYPLPMFHIGGVLFLTLMLAARGTFLGMSHFERGAALDMIKRVRPTILYPLFPTITLPLIEHRGFAAADLSRVRYIFNVAPEGTQRKIQAAIPHARLFSAFGMTETCGTVTFGTPGDSDEQRLTTCGSPLPGWTVKIVDPETRAAVAIDAHGEIAVRGRSLFQGYFNDPDRTKPQLLADGFFLTGDIGKIDENGHLSFLGRLKDQLKVGGENVSALEIESFLGLHPAISLAQAIGVPDAKYGEVPAVFIELKSGQSLTAAGVIAFCNGRIARFKIPRYVRFVKEWPMSATKILKYRLKEQLQAELDIQESA